LGNTTSTADPSDGLLLDGPPSDSELESEDSSDEAGGNNNNGTSSSSKNNSTKGSQNSTQQASQAVKVRYYIDKKTGLKVRIVIN